MGRRKMNEKHEVISIYLPSSMIDRLDELADCNDRTRSALIKIAIENMLEVYDMCTEEYDEHDAK